MVFIAEAGSKTLCRIRRTPTLIFFFAYSAVSLISVARLAINTFFGAVSGFFDTLIINNSDVCIGDDNDNV